MIITITGIAFSISSIGLAFCGIRFFKAFQKMGGLQSGSQLGILLSILFIGFSFQHGILAIGGLFFAQISEALYAILVIDHIVLTFVTALAVYLAFYILLPKISPWPVTIGVLALGFFGTALTIFGHPQPFIDANNSIDWNMERPAELSIYYLLLFSLAAPFLIFVKNFFQTFSRDVKTVSFILALTHFLGLVNVSILFSGLLDGKDSLRTNAFDKVLGVIGILFVIGFLIIPIVNGWVLKGTNNKIAQ